MKIPFKQLATKHADSLAAFVAKMVDHPGVINSQYVYQVIEKDNQISLAHPERINGEYINGGIRIPGEITNSFCTLYEIGYFANALFLNAVVSALPVEKYKSLSDLNQRKEKIKEGIQALSDDQIEHSFHHPKIPMTSWLTDDVETYRFRKEVLWGVKKEMSKKIIGQITKEDMGQDISDEFYNILWIDRDREITNTAIKLSSNMCEAKMIQYHIALKEFFAMVGVDTTSMPFYFFSSPHHEVLDLGADHPFLDFLIEMHTPESLKAFSKITKQQNPVLIKMPCPNCGQSSKKVLQGRVKGKDKRTVHLVCATGEKSFKNEHGLGTAIVKGCGHVWEFQIPNTKHELYEFFKRNGVDLHITLTNSLQLFRNTAISPVAHLIGDLNIYYDDQGTIKVFSPYPGGYGSSAELFTSVMAIQLAMFKGLLAPQFMTRAKQENILVDSPFMIIAHQSPTRLFDPSEIYENIKRDFNIEAGPQDSSIWKALENGMQPEDIIVRAIDTTYYPAEKMVKDIRGLDLNAFSI